MSLLACVCAMPVYHFGQVTTALLISNYTFPILTFSKMIYTRCVISKMLAGILLIKIYIVRTDRICTITAQCLMIFLGVFLYQIVLLICVIYIKPRSIRKIGSKKGIIQVLSVNLWLRIVGCGNLSIYFKIPKCWLHLNCVLHSLFNINRGGGARTTGVSPSKVLAPSLT